MNYLDSKKLGLLAIIYGIYCFSYYYSTLLKGIVLLNEFGSVRVFLNINASLGILLAIGSMLFSISFIVFGFGIFIRKIKNNKGWLLSLSTFFLWNVFWIIQSVKMSGFGGIDFYFIISFFYIVTMLLALKARIVSPCRK